MNRFCEFSISQRKTLTILGMGLLLFGGYKIVTMSHPALSDAAPMAETAVWDDYESPLILDINHSPADSLELVPGIGPVLSRRIVDFRRTHGDFTAIDSLVNVKGIGPKTLAKIRVYFRDIAQ